MRVIQAGVGGFGESWVWAIKNVGFQHVAIVDANPSALENAKNILGLPTERCFSNVEEALCKVEADGFVDVTPAPLHVAHSGKALERGLHVLVEKPMAESMEEAQHLVRLAKQKNRVLMVTQQKRYENEPRQIRRMIDDGAIGEIDHVVVDFQIQGVMAGWRKTMKHPFLLDMAVHQFDLLRYLLGRNAVRVIAQTWNPRVSNAQGDMSAFALMEFEGGARVNYTGSFASPGMETGWSGRWEITGSRGSIVWNERDEYGKIRYFRQDADLSHYEKQHFFEGLGWGEVIHPADIGAKGHHFDLYHWRWCIQEGHEPETSGRDNLHTLALTFATIKSAETGGAVTLSTDIES